MKQRKTRAPPSRPHIQGSQASSNLTGPLCSPFTLTRQARDANPRGSRNEGFLRRGPYDQGPQMYAGGGAGGTPTTRSAGATILGTGRSGGGLSFLAPQINYSGANGADGSSFTDSTGNFRGTGGAGGVGYTLSSFPGTASGGGGSGGSGIPGIPVYGALGQPGYALLIW